MTLRFQNNILTAGLIISLLSLLLFLSGVYLLWEGGMEGASFRFSGENPRWTFFPYQETPGAFRLLLNALFSIFGLLIFSLLANAAFRNLFRKTSSPEIFFMMLLLVSLCLESLRIGIILMQSDLLPIPGWVMPVYFSILLTRAVYLGRFFALLCLLVSSLFATGIKYSNHSILLGILLLLSITLVSQIPIDSTILLSNFLYRLGDRRGYLLVNASLGLFALINFLRAGLVRKSRRFFPMAAAALMIFVGKELVYAGISPFPLILGGILLFSGVAVFSRQIGIFYLLV